MRKSRANRHASYHGVRQTLRARKRKRTFGVKLCEQCRGLFERRLIDHPYQLYQLVNQVLGFIARNSILDVEANCNLADIGEELPWPEDHISFKFACTKCKQHFVLHCETYHGAGGAWEPVEQ